MGRTKCARRLSIAAIEFESRQENGVNFIGHLNVMLDAATIQRFENALLDSYPRALKELAMNLASEGLSQAAIYHVFDSFGHYLREAGRDPFEQACVWGAIESIVGCGSRQSWWFDHFLTKEELDAYRTTIGHPLHPRCFYVREK